MDQVTWPVALRRGARSGAVASVASTVLLVACGKRERDDAARPINGPSQWIWGRGAPHVHGFDLQHTVVGYAIHHAMSVMWATCFERYRPQRASPAATVAAAAATATIAYVADFRVVPKRLSPGFETELSRPCVISSYAAFAAAIACTALIARTPRVTTNWSYR